MTSWKEERDRLVAQTLAFVQEVAAAHPAAPQPMTGMEPTTDNAKSVASSERGPQLCNVNDIQSADQHHARYSAVASAASDRTDIMKRVAAFKARQVQMIKDRETYYEAMQVRIRSSLRNESERDRL